MFLRAKYVLQFSRRDDLQNILLDPAIENRRIVWTCMFEAAGSKAERSISYNYRFNIVTRCNDFFLNAYGEIRRISEEDVLPKRSKDNVTWSYFRP